MSDEPTRTGTAGDTEASDAGTGVMADATSETDTAAAGGPDAGASTSGDVSGASASDADAGDLGTSIGSAG